MTDWSNSHSRHGGKTRTHDRASGRTESRGAPDLIIASLQQRGAAIGPNSHTDQFERYLQDAGIRCQVLTPFSDLKPLAYPVLAARRMIDLVSKPVGVWWFLRFRRLFLRRCISRALRPDRDTVIYAKCLNSARAALEARKSPRQRVVMAVHFNRSEAEEWHRAGRIKQGDWVYRGIRSLEAELLAKLDGLHFVSNYMRDYIFETHPEAAGCRSIVLPNFIEDPGRSKNGELRGDLISIGSLEPRKNQGYLLRVLHEARRMGHSYSLTLVGQGPDRRRLLRLARELGVVEKVRFVGLKRGAARMLPSYRAYVHSALIENLPFVLIEAAACGMPILAGPVGGVPEVVLDGMQGFHWPLDDPKKGAQKLIAVLEDEATHARLAEAARRQFEAKFSAEKVGPQLADFLLGHVDA
jgi:glycosyltransferase involved in cell wall biosynthesis